jgi:hypothetical protein
MNFSKHLRIAAFLLSATAGLVLAQVPDGQKPFRQKAAQDKDLRPCVPDCPTGGRFHSFDPAHPPPAGAKPFRLSQDYPDYYSPSEKFPWAEIDYAVAPEKYLRAVLAYCLDGNIEVEFRGQENPKRKWYHAPWMHDDGDKNKAGAGREYHHGLTRERRSREFELHTLQKSKCQNWAVGMVNDRGGYTLGQVWDTSEEYPDPTRATFPDNTVSFKLLFTDAQDAEVPFLAGSKKWTANIYQDVNNYAPPRVDREVRLLQLDIAVKDPRVGARSGWIFGTFVYDGGRDGPDVWDRLAFVGLSWGDDDEVTEDLTRKGAFVNPTLKETCLNAELVEKPGHEYGAKAYMRHFGLGGRLNGPVDNPVSSCISCHGRAGTYAKPLPLNEKSGLPMETGLLTTTDPTKFPVAEFARYFRTVRPNSHLEQDKCELWVTTDFSLQIPAGIRNFYQHLRTQEPVVERLEKRGAVKFTAAEAPRLKPLPSQERGEMKRD